ncbi:urease accessory protein UreF [Oceanospirillum sp.]|uniref:urease accessory protein UreF n=1 Tax=Oceanospirillum sp. TaxID=2021254 RepID=UPI003A9414D9
MNTEPVNVSEPIAPALTGLSLVRLMHLASVSLPVGGYAFSHGMEYAIEAGWIRKADQVEHWVREQLHLSLSGTDLPLLRLSMQACAQENWPDSKYIKELKRINELTLACRETHELTLTDTAMGEALMRLMNSLQMSQPFSKGEPVSFIGLFALAASLWQIPYRAAANGFLWSWLENQIAAATKLVPLGQTQAQQLLVALQPELETAIEQAELIAEEEIGAGLPALAIASSQHEHMYSRLFRS